MDLAAVGEIVEGQGLALGVVVAVFLAGLRHGFDVDHIAAISDITSSQQNPRRSLVLATTYALGHMLVLFALGMAAVIAGERIPEAVDSLAGRIIGFTLIALGVYVVYSLIRFRRDFRMRSRWMLVLAGARRALHWIRPSRQIVIEHEHEHAPDGHHDHVFPSSSTSPTAGGAVATAVDTHTHTHKHVVPMPSDPFTEYGKRTSFFVGMIHGVGAETPTQVLLFTTAAGLGGSTGGILLVGAFVIGLLLGNSVLAVATTFGFSAGKKLPVVYMGLAAVTALVSMYVGSAYLFQRAESLPAFLGG